MLSQEDCCKFKGILDCTVSPGCLLSHHRFRKASKSSWGAVPLSWHGISTGSEHLDLVLSPSLY